MAASRTTTQALVAHVRAFDADRDDLQDRVRLLVADHLAMARAGMAAQAVTVAARWLDEVAGDALGGSLRDAMVAAVAAHGTEMDDTHSPSSTHPGAVIVPAALAVGAWVGAPMELVVRGIVRGYETMARLGELAQPARVYERGYHPTAIVGGIAASVTAADLLSLDAADQAGAIGIAGTATAGRMSFLQGGAWTKRLHPALAIRTGVDAAILAREGFVAPADGIGGVGGLMAALGHEPESDLRFDDSRPAVLETGLKPHACCRYIQPAIDAALRIREEVDDVVNIVNVTIGLPSVALPIVAEPSDEKRRPRNEVEAQFSAPYGVAVALHLGRAGPREFAAPMDAPPAVREFADRTSIVADPALDDAYPQRWGAWVLVRRREGEDVRAAVPSALGDPDHPLNALGFANKLETVGVRDPLPSKLVNGAPWPEPRTLLRWAVG